MRKSLFVRAVMLFMLGSACLTLGGCGDSMSGKYEWTGITGSMSIHFKSGGKADVTMSGKTVESKYDVSEDKITFHDVNGKDLVMTIEKDGSLSGGPSYANLKKVASD